MPELLHYHQYVIDQHRDWTGYKKGLRLLYNGSSTYQVIPSSNGPDAALYGANPEKPLVYFEGGDDPHIHFRGLEDDNRLVEHLPVNQFLRTSSDGMSKLIKIGDQSYWWDLKLDKTGRVKYTMSRGKGRNPLIYAELEVNSLSYLNNADPMRLRILNPNAYDLERSRGFYAIVASIVVMCQHRDPWVEPAGIWC